MTPQQLVQMGIAPEILIATLPAPPVAPPIQVPFSPLSPNPRFVDLSSSISPPMQYRSEETRDTQMSPVQPPRNLSESTSLQSFQSNETLDSNISNVSVPVKAPLKRTVPTSPRSGAKKRTKFIDEIPAVHIYDLSESETDANDLPRSKQSTPTISLLAEREAELKRMKERIAILMKAKTTNQSSTEDISLPVQKPAPIVPKVIDSMDNLSASAPSKEDLSQLSESIESLKKESAEVGQMIDKTKKLINTCDTEVKELETKLSQKKEQRASAIKLQKQLELRARAVIELSRQKSSQYSKVLEQSKLAEEMKVVQRRNSTRGYSLALQLSKGILLCSIDVPIVSTLPRKKSAESLVLKPHVSKSIYLTKWAQNASDGKAPELGRFYSSFSSESAFEDHLKNNPGDIVTWISYFQYSCSRNFSILHDTRALPILARALGKNSASPELWLLYMDLYTKRNDPEHTCALFEHGYDSLKLDVHALVCFRWTHFLNERDPSKRLAILSHLLEDISGIYFFTFLKLLNRYRR